MNATLSAPLVILAAEDDPDDRLMLQDAFRECRLHPVLRFVEDGRALLDSLRRREGGAPLPDLVVLDLAMPRVDGFEALGEIKTDPALRRIPVVVFATSREPEDVARAYRLGAASFIAKPLTFLSLVGVSRLLDAYWGGLVRRPSLKPGA